MIFNQNILKFDEKAVFILRELYSKYGYRQFKMSKFEEYDLYSKNKDFLVSDGVITFNDTNGKLLALKPDVTLSIIKNSQDAKGVTEKFYYNENVYRISESSHTYKEIMQTGLECIGEIGESEIFEVTELAAKSLSLIDKDFMLHLSHIGLINALFDEYKVNESVADKITEAITEKNAGILKSLLSESQFNALKVLVKSYESTASALSAIESIAKSDASKSAFCELKSTVANLSKIGFSEKLSIDFSIISQNSYYCGVVFKGYISGIASRVLSGGQYDKLMQRMGRSSSAIGFAVYLDTLERLPDKTEADEMINIALPKGRLGEKVYAMFEAAGFDCPSIKENNRKLIFENKEKGIRFFWVKPSDVAIYVERGAADIGVAGKDILLEYTPDVFELLDLNIGKCRMAVAAKKDFCDDTSKTLRVATKFSNIAKNYYAKKCREIDIIHLNGSIEIAPILGLSDVIVDIVETGKTLLENDLAPFETITPISARLISNKASFSFKLKKIEEIKKGLLSQVKTDD
ncbi:MAG: ATP phosphoribosyltransferase [Ruminococcaceae bacterium]|nr:ATP phosphoribosyltransferase [Oscillospiraceae bacterium]